MNKNIHSTNWLKFYLLICSILFIFLLSFSLNSYCIQNKSECFKIGPVTVPNDTPSKFIGIFLTFTAYYLLERIKKNDEQKPKLEVSFNEEEKNELSIKSQPHYIFSPRTQENIKFGEAYYLRVKVTNKGNEIAKQCRGYLKNIRKFDAQKGEFTKLEKCEGSMRLLWAYERKEDYRSTNFEQIPSGASEYLDVLVSYHPALKPKHLDRDQNTWFLG